MKRKFIRFPMKREVKPNIYFKNGIWRVDVRKKSFNKMVEDANESAIMFAVALNENQYEQEKENQKASQPATT